MTERRRVLVTNDDGIHATGLRWLAQAAVAAGFEVVVAAPDYEASGSSAALTAIYRDKRLAVNPVDLGHDLSVEAYGVRASPGYVVMLAIIGTFGRRPDLVLSGINHGANTGHVVLHSGTVGAALTAANHGVRGMAVSFDVELDEEASGSLSEYFSGVESDSLHWDTASEVAGRCLSIVDGLPGEAILNLNVPNRPLSALAGVREARLAPFGQVTMSVAETGAGYVRTKVERATERLAPDTDRALLKQGYATLTVITTVREVPSTLDVDGLLTAPTPGSDDRTPAGPQPQAVA